MTGPTAIYEPGKPPRYECSQHGLETGDEAEFGRHVQESHPFRCSGTVTHGNLRGERPLAAYRYFNGKYSYFYCAECADRDWGDNETFRNRVVRVERAANQDAERLPGDHPVERVIAEREGSL